MGSDQALDRDAEEHDPPRFAVDAPARDTVFVRLGGHVSDMEFDVAQFGPCGTEKVGCRADRDVEALESGVERPDRWPDDGAPALSAVPPVAIRAWPGIAAARGLSSPSDHASILGRWPVAHLRRPGTGHPDRALGRASRRAPRAADAGADRPTTLTSMHGRLCSKVGCAREAISTLTYDYGDQMAALGPLGAADDPHAHDLCAIHTERMSVPKGWVVVRHETLRA